jgi:hypothetical protein
MDSIIGLLKDTPIPTILVVSGIIFLFLALAGSVAGKLEMPPTRQKWSAVVSLVLITAGLLLYVAPAAPGVVAAPPSPTPLPAMATQPAASLTEALPTAPDASAEQASSSLPAPAELSTGAGCLVDFFASIPENLITSMEVGASKDLPTAAETSSGIILEEFGQPVTALTFMLFEDDQLFKIAAVVDAACQPVEFENISRGGDPSVLQNWDTLQVSTAGGDYVLRFGYYAGETSVDTGKIK